MVHHSPKQQNLDVTNQPTRSCSNASLCRRKLKGACGCPTTQSQRTGFKAAVQGPCLTNSSPDPRPMKTALECTVVQTDNTPVGVKRTMPAHVCCSTPTRCQGSRREKQMPVASNPTLQTPLHRLEQSFQTCSVHITITSTDGDAAALSL